MSYRKLRRVCVEWEDAVTTSGYFDPKDPKDGSLCKCKTVGWLARKNKDTIVMITNMFEDGELRHTHTIPRKTVKKITYLEEKI